MEQTNPIPVQFLRVQFNVIMLTYGGKYLVQIASQHTLHAFRIPRCRQSSTAFPKERERVEISWAVGL